jgi:hypothetical protein
MLLRTAHLNDLWLRTSRSAVSKALLWLCISFDSSAVVRPVVHSLVFTLILCDAFISSDNLYDANATLSAALALSLLYSIWLFYIIVSLHSLLSIPSTEPCDPSLCDASSYASS